jgi:hypothetical protein
MKARTDGLVSLITTCVLASACAPEATHARVLAADPTTLECQNCASDVERTLVRDALADRSDVDVNGWLASHFTANASYYQERFSGAAIEEKCEAFARVVTDPQGFTFSWPGGRLVYAQVHSMVIDGYFPHMERISVSGRRLWRRRVPTLELPVCPFVVGDRIVYVSSVPPGGRQALVVLHLETGTTLRKVDLPFAEGCQSSIDNSVDSFPFAWSGHAVIPSARSEWSGDLLDPATSHRHVPTQILVAPLQ